MLEDPRGEKVTTAALAAKLDVSEAALYRQLRQQSPDVRGLDRVHRNFDFGLINDISTKGAVRSAPGPTHRSDAARVSRRPPG